MTPRRLTRVYKETACQFCTNCDQRALRIGIFEAFGERDSGESFADGDGVKPDGTGAIGGEFGEFGEGKAETFGEIGEIFVMAKPLDEPVGGGKQGGEAH